MWLQLNTFTFLGIACLNLTPDVPIASAASSFCMIMWNLLCGFMVYRKVRYGAQSPDVRRTPYGGVGLTRCPAPPSAVLHSHRDH